MSSYKRFIWRFITMALPSRQALFSIFAAMMRKRYTRILLLFLALLLLCREQQLLLAAPVSAECTPVKEAVLISNDGLPHDALEKIQPPVSAGAHPLNQKNTSSLIVLPVSVQPGGTALTLILYSRQSILPVKDYLFHIYPTHHFW